MIPKKIIQTTTDDRKIIFAYKKPPPHTNIILCFIPGFKSDFITSKKAQVVYNLAEELKVGFLSWNHHQDMTSVVDWYRDGVSLLCNDYDYYLIGASMGLWISLLIATTTKRIRGIVGIGGSIDFTERWLSEEAPSHDANVIWKRPSEYAVEGYYEIPVSFLLNSRPALLLQGEEDMIVIPCPIYLIHGEQDKDVRFEEAKEFANHLLKGRNHVYFYQIRELMADHRKRAERRRAYYESKLGDPQQLIRVIGSSSKLYPDAEQFYYHENPDNLMPWQGNPDIKIDRFDGRSLLDYIPDSTKNSYQDFSKDDKEISDELNFERYHDLIEAERLNVSETERLAEVEEEWTKLLDRHQAKLALLKNQERTHSKNHTFGYDYGTGKVNNEDLYQDNHDEKASRLLKDIL
ncbi:alternative splicing regulator-domain-containing protein [Cokeromyces recurvatus]|uniref:alternative splicing regulator-domain-containing protein n=1 Tax=Cokeromyces recurvatus TaxID=90255 RepID=UPI00221F09A0|nr:alternative splicing regulator-domain-containing protein [Cokeromyces recurvatus]KAI7898333.1 alternative splicing regulator-domain-containing protein [Cokeromyces recurvatus]